MPERVVEIYGGGGVGGAAQHLRLLCQGLADRGWEVCLLSLPPHSLADDLERRGVDVVRAQGAADARARLRGLDGLLHAHGTRALAVALAARRPFVRTVHSFIHQDYRSVLRRLPAILLDRRSFRAARRIITVSEALHQDLLRRGCPRERLVTVHNGVAPPPPARAREEVLAEFGWTGDGPLLFMAARLHPVKGVDRALAALAELPTARLLVFGEGPSAAELAHQAEELGVAQRVRFAGFSPVARAYLGAADVVLMPSRQEGLPFTAVEAMAAGVPVVATPLPGLREALGEAAVFRDGEAASLADGVREALARREELAQAGLERYRQEFSAQHFLEATDVVLRQALGAP